MFAALADGTRRRVASLLSEQGPLTATEIAARLPVTRQAVAKHLDWLEAAGLVASTRSGRESHYRLTPEPFEVAALWMASLGAQWDERLARLQQLIEGRRAPRR